ncbi:MAG: Abi family protein [Verrucomicrobiota bacterium]
MSKVFYVKPATTCLQQVALLRQRGMLIEDEAEAAFYLKHLNYYRLSAYWLPFEQTHATHTFRPGTSFQQVLALYVFDRELRLLTMDALERVEVSVRTQWASQIGHRHGPHGHLNPQLAYRSDHWQKNIALLTAEVERSDEIFIRHFTSKYQEQLPPVWAVCEVMSLGLLSRWYANLKPMPTRRAIASTYGLDERVFASWLHRLTLIRNVCAHHGRLWDRQFPLSVTLPQRPAALATQMQTGCKGIYNALLMLLHFMDQISPNHHWRRKLTELIETQNVYTSVMGAPPNWKSQPLWSLSSQSSTPTSCP